MAEAVAQAVLASVDHKSTQHRRDQAFQYLEKIKNNLNETVGISLKLTSHPHPAVKHYAFRSFMVLIRTQWKRLSIAQQEDLKRYALRMFQMSTSISEPFLREKISDVVTEIAFKDWPQRWTRMFPLLCEAAGVNSGKRNATLVLMLLRIVRNLAGKIIDFDPSVPEKRCREIQEGIRKVLLLIQRVLVLSFSLPTEELAKTKESRNRAIKLGLEAIKSLVDWVDPAFIYGDLNDTKQGILPKVFQAFITSEHCVIAADILVVICQKTTNDKYNQILRQLWGPLLDTNKKLFNTKMQDPTRWVKLMLSVLSPLGKMTRYHLNLVSAKGEHNMPKIRQALLQYLLAMLNNRSISLAKAAAELWIFILRYKWEEAVDSSWREALLTQITEACIRQNRRRSWTRSLEASEYETEAEHRAGFSALRSQVRVMFELATKLAPLLSLKKHVQSYMKSLKDVSRIKQGETTEIITEANFILDAHVSGLESVIRSIPKKDKKNNNVIGMLGMLLQELLKVKNLPSASEFYRLQTIGCLHPLYKCNQQALGAALKALLQGVQHRPDSQKNVMASALDKDTQITRKRSLTSLIAIAKHERTELLPLFEKLSSEVEKMISQEGRLKDEEKMTLIESLIPITNAMPESKQIAFIKKIVDKPLKSFDDISSHFKDTKTFGISAGLATAKAMVSSKSRQFRQEIWWCLDLVRVIFRHALKRLPSVIKILTKERIRALLMLLRCCNQLLLPQFLSSSSPSLRAALVDTRAALEEELKKLPYSAPKLVVREIHVWFRTIRACGYSLLGTAAKGLPVLFFGVAGNDNIGGTAFEGLQSMPPIYLKVVLDQLLPNYLTCYPLENQAQRQSFARTLQPILQGMFTRLSRGWSHHQESKNFRTNELVEIRAISSLTDSTKSFVGSLCELFCVPLGISGMTFIRNTFYAATPTTGSNNPHDAKKHGERKLKNNKINPYVPTRKEIDRSNYVVHFILSDQRLSQALFTVLVGMMAWPTNDSVVNACTLIVRLIPELSKPKNKHILVRNAPMLTKAFRMALRMMSCLKKELEEIQHNAYTTVLKEIYSTFVPKGMNNLRQILGSLPGVEKPQISFLEKSLMQEKANKSHRRVSSVVFAR